MPSRYTREDRRTARLLYLLHSWTRTQEMIMLPTTPPIITFLLADHAAPMRGSQQEAHDIFCRIVAQHGGTLIADVSAPYGAVFL